MVLNVLKVFGLSTLSFIIGMLLTPLLTHYLYKYKMWRTEARTHAAPDGSATPIFRELHKERETRVPRMGGILIWFVPLLVTLLFWMLSFTDRVIFQKLNFLSRSQTWLPLFTLVAASLVGVADDLRTVYWKSKNAAGGIRFSRRLIMIFLIALVGAWWFYFKLDASHVNIPFYGDFEIGFLFPIFFIFVMLATFSGSVIDGIDGLAGGVMAMIFTAYAGIAFFQNQIDLAAFSAVVGGALAAFLWFNIPPARFYMGETGILGLTTALTVIAFLTNAVLVLPIIALPLVLDAGSVIIQLFSKKFLKRKIFLVAPLHHHFEAMGWPPYKVTMRAWVLTYVAALVGVIIQLLG
uniref:Phospho-N-acetylmuramoyl-pentapeptide-transferase n=1 Tax=Candidatus Giovannonibacteria bacterium GW2011_GWF2_42_19 TaxID=1618659 RepID=A0A0G1CCB3_9BACT|nr:MAG: Phospho-N-acetylmuramoyl-pentapeptide-transferase [Candidatus Giovannonibacteria bacterium GW2011_GWF2_42_19]